MRVRCRGGGFVCGGRLEPDLPIVRSVRLKADHPSYVVSGFSRTVEQNQAPTVRPWHVTASRYAFDPPRIEVLQDDLVKIELRTEDIAHSLTIDAYRIAKRVNPGQPITFEFRADQPGTFPFYCNLQIDDGCRQTPASSSSNLASRSTGRSKDRPLHENGCRARAAGRAACPALLRSEDFLPGAGFHLFFDLVAGVIRVIFPRPATESCLSRRSAGAASPTSSSADSVGWGSQGI